MGREREAVWVVKEAGRGAEVLGISPRSLLRLLPVARPQSGKEQQPAS